MSKTFVNVRLTFLCNRSRLDLEDDLKQYSKHEVRITLPSQGSLYGFSCLNGLS